VSEGDRSLIPPPPEGQGEFLVYQTEDGGARVACRFAEGTVWLTQAAMAGLFQTTPQNITLHIARIYEDQELQEDATCKEYLQVRHEGNRQVRRSLKYYTLPMILAVGYRVRSSRGTLFRQWASAHLEEYLVKGFTMDDERLKQSGGGDYFEELLARIRRSVSSGARCSIFTRPVSTTIPAPKPPSSSLR
jgi:hypothetical protein